MVLQDKIGMSDEKKTLRGFVSLFDNVKQQYLFKNKENMIMSSGREYVKQLFVTHSGILSSNSEPKFPRQLGSEFKLSACVFGTDSNVSQYDMTYVPSNYVLDYTIFNDSPEFSVTFTEDLVLELTINLNGSSTNQTMISNIALVLTTADNSGDAKTLLTSGDESKTALFSRLVFDPIPVGAGTSQTITYCIYF